MRAFHLFGEAVTADARLLHAAAPSIRTSAEVMGEKVAHEVLDECPAISTRGPMLGSNGIRRSTSSAPNLARRMNRNYLKGRDADRISAVLAPPATTSASSSAGLRRFCVRLSDDLPVSL
jgi:hypothetical protein